MCKSIALILFLIIVGCKEGTPDGKKVEKINSEIQNHELQEVFQLILDVPDFQMWLHGDVPERIPLKLIKSELVSEQIDLQKFGKRVRIVDSSAIKQEGIEDAISIKLRNIEKDTMTFSLYHSIEGAHMYGKLYFKNDKWQIIVRGIGEE